MIYALFFAAISAVAGIFGLIQTSPGGTMFAKSVHLTALVIFVVFLALAKLPKQEEPPFP